MIKGITNNQTNPKYHLIITMDYIDDKNKSNNDILLQKTSSSSYSDDEDEETTIHICKLLHQIFEPYQQEQQLAINEMLSIERRLAIPLQKSNLFLSRSIPIIDLLHSLKAIDH